MDVQTLCEIAEIRKLKARYRRLLDTEQWDEWAQVFAPDVILDASGDVNDGMGDPIIQGRDKMVAQTRGIMAGSISMLQVHEPEIELTSATTATGIWPKWDRTEFPEGVEAPGPFTRVEGLGYYHETYEKVEDSGYFKTTKLVRVHKAFS